MRLGPADIATNAILAARGRAARIDEGDAEALPYPDAAFDVVVRIFGAMFAPRPERGASELMRVCRPGGTIAMGNWTREGFIGQMFKTIARFIAPPGMPAPVLWGDEGVVRERFSLSVSDLRPAARAFATLGEVDTTALRAELVQLWTSHNQASEPSRTIVDAEYLEVVGVRA